LWLLNTKVKEVFRPEVELTLFMSIRTKEISKALGKCMPILICYRK